MRTTCLVFLFARFLSVKPFPLSCSFNVTSQLCDYQVNYAENIAWDTDQDGDRAINYVKLIFKSVTLNVTIREGLDQTTCLSFGYYVTGSGSIRLVKRVLKDVEHNTELGYNVLFEVDQLKRLAAKWYFFNLTIPRLGPNNVFEFELKRLDDRSEARLSSLTTTQGDCVPKSNSCDFDHVNGFAADTCQLFSMNYTLPEYQWRITEPHGDYSRPEIDHSVAGQSGRFLSTEPTSEVPIGTEASLTLTKPVLGTTCLYFWYFRPQQIPLDNLTIVDNRGRRLWTANMSSYDWQRGQVEIAQVDHSRHFVGEIH
ncbi:hypothetical protein HDE_09763 [Halotydeus destructor]|nr:hypothetical protein HDE_09763 [Halotydeus destructor]